MSKKNSTLVIEHFVKLIKKSSLNKDHTCALVSCLLESIKKKQEKVSSSKNKIFKVVCIHISTQQPQYLLVLLLNPTQKQTITQTHYIVTNHSSADRKSVYLESDSLLWGKLGMFGISCLVFLDLIPIQSKLNICCFSTYYSFLERPVLKLVKPMQFKTSRSASKLICYILSYMEFWIVSVENASASDYSCLRVWTASLKHEKNSKSQMQIQHSSSQPAHWCVLSIWDVH